MSRVNVQATEMKQHRQFGLSLVELMIALLLGVIISAGVLNVFIASKRGYYEDEQMASMQENARFGLRLLRREVSLAGFMGGQPSIADVYTSTVVMGTDCPPGSGWALDFAAGPIEFVNDVAAGNSDPCVSDALNDAAFGVESDVIAVRRSADDYTISLTAYPEPDFPDGQNPAAAVPAGEGLFLVNKNCPDVAGVADPNPCLLYGKDVATAAQKSAAAAVAEGGEDTFQASEYYAKSIYVRNFSSVAGDGIPCLVISALNTVPEMAANCMVEGVQAVQLMFGLDLDGDRVPNKYVEDLTGTELIDGNAVDRIRLVTSAKIYMLVRSTNEVQGHLDTKTYTVGTKEMGPFNDKFYRRVYNTSVRVPNIIQIDS